MTAPLVELRAREREALLATLRAVGPDARTLCAGWSASDIAAHIVVSEQAFGIPLAVFNVVRRLLPARLTRRIIDGAQPAGDRLNARTKHRGWDRTLGRLAAGPPALYRYGTLAELRTVEEWIHHEDVRRGSGAGPRATDPALDAALWRAGTCVARFPEVALGREGLELVTPDGRRFVVGDGTVRLRATGEVGELLLYLAGRCGAAEVSLDGDRHTVEALEPRLRV